MDDIGVGPAGRFAVAVVMAVVGVLLGLYGIAEFSHVDEGSRVTVAVIAPVAWTLAAVFALMVPFQANRRWGKGFQGLLVGIVVFLAALLRSMGDDVVDTVSPILLG